MTFLELLEASGKKVSDEQLAAIMTDSAAVVSAGAGSGKTTVLSLRFVRLVLSGKAHADEILTLTFTKKAAAEMYERIYSLLSLAASNDSSLEDELTVHFPNARISTMDSFWSEIARTDSLRFGITRDFQSLEAEEGATEELVREVYDELQEREDLEEGFMILSALYKTADLLEMLTRIASSETDILTDFNVSENAASYRAFIKLLDARCDARASFIFSSLFSLDEANPVNGQHEEIQRALEAYRDENYADLPVFNLNKLRKAADKDIRTFIKDEDCKAFFERLRALQNLKATAGDAEAVSKVLEAFIKAVQSRKRILGALSYRDTESLCREVLISNTDVRDYYKNHFKFIMVDEFQDNNSKQRDLLYLLAEKYGVHSPSIPDVKDVEPGKLFFVGDDKQSIYYFRGADVSVFRSLKLDIERMGGVNLSLSANYRSEPALINHFNYVFSSVFDVTASEDDIEKESLFSDFTGIPYTSFYASSETIKSRDPKAGVNPAIELYTIDADSAEEGDASTEDSEALFIARKIMDMVTGDDYLIPDDDGKLRRPCYGDIAILLRTTAPQMPIERAFRLYGIPYTVQESTSSTIEGVGWDIYAFLNLLIYPEDRLSYMAVLRSPFARISDEGLLFLTSDRNPAFSTDPEFAAESDRISYESVKTLYFELRGMVGRRRISEILTHLFYESGYSAYLNSSLYLGAYAEHFSYIWASAVLYDSAGRSLPAFLDYLRPLIGQAKKLSNATVQHLETDGVQIMTIHRSKGLQFPIVFLSDADHGSSNQAARDNLITFEGKNPCIMPDLVDNGPNLILQEKSAYTQRRESAELRRLLYVALTRSVDHIIVTAHLRKRHTGISLFDIYREGWPISAEEIPSAGEEELFQKTEHADRSKWYSQEISPPPEYSHRRFGVKDAAKKEVVSFEGGEALPALLSDSIISTHGAYDVFGTMVHSLLESLVKGENPVISYPPEFSTAEKETLALALNEIEKGFLSSQFYQQVIMPNKKETEVRFYYPVDGAVAEGSADLLVFCDDWNLVVDYKTDKFMNEGLHKGQITAYAEAMEKLYGKKCYAVLLYVRGWKASTPLDKTGNPVTGISLP